MRTPKVQVLMFLRFKLDFRELAIGFEDPPGPFNRSRLLQLKPAYVLATWNWSF